MDRDPLLEELRQLKAIAPPRELNDQVAAAALAVLAAGPAASAASPLKGTTRWRAGLEFALYRAAIPTALAGATVIYLSWAVSAASHLY